MSDLSFLAHPSITFKLGNLAHCINNELADRYFHVCYLSWVIYDDLCSASCTLKPKKPLKNSKKPRFFPALRLLLHYNFVQNIYECAKHAMYKVFHAKLIPRNLPNCRVIWLAVSNSLLQFNNNTFQLFTPICFRVGKFVPAGGG